MNSLSLEDRAIAAKTIFPIIHQGNPYAGKVRVVYWLSLDQSRKLAERKGYDVLDNQELGIMITTDGISAFDTNWHGEKGLKGVPGKGASLNHISEYFFNKLKEKGVINNHIVDTPSPMAWVVKKADPIRVEGIQRRIITGSMFRAYKENPNALFCGQKLPEGLQNYDPIGKLMLTPTTKGTMRGLLGVPAKEDTPISRQNIYHNMYEFGFKNKSDISLFEEKQRKSFVVVEDSYRDGGYVLGDMKVEIGYVKDEKGEWNLILLDEVGSPDAIRSYRIDEYNARVPGEKLREESKEAFREHLFSTVDNDLLLNDARYEERKAFSKVHEIPLDQILELSGIYREIAENITGKPVPTVQNPREQIMDAMSELGLTA